MADRLSNVTVGDFDVEIARNSRETRERIVPNRFYRQRLRVNEITLPGREFTENRSRAFVVPVKRSTSPSADRFQTFSPMENRRRRVSRLF